MASPASSRATPLAALLTVLVLLVAACGDDSGGEASTETTAAGGATTTTVLAGEGPSDLPAATLRADLTGLLEEQVFLVGITVEQALAGRVGLAGAEAAATTETADASAADLADVVGTAYGAGPGADFLDVWKPHQRALLAYGVGQGSARAVDEARQAVLDVLTALDPALGDSVLPGDLQASDEELMAALDEVRADTPTAARDLRLAVNQMPQVALALADAFAEHSQLEGNVRSDEAQLRADLTGLLQEHVYLVGLGLAELIQASGDVSGPAVQGTFDSVDDNASDLSLSLEDDPSAAQELLDLWREHVTYFQDYTIGRFIGDATRIEQARSDLAAWRDDVGRLLAQKYDGLSKEAIAEELVPHVDSVLAYADATAISDVTAAGLLRQAAQVMPDVARTLAAAITTST